MKIAVMQPYFFPYLGYWQLLNAVDKFVVFDDVNYIKKGYINRNSILVNGNLSVITLELIKLSQNKLINEIEIGNNLNKLLKTIEMSYKKAPYFKIAFPIIQDVFSQKEKNLAKFLGNSIEEVSAFFEIENKIIYSSEIEKDKNLKAQDKILDICQQLGASTYINAIGGQSMYSKDDFGRKKIELKFIQTELIEYKQFNNEFINGLSIIDVMMFNSKKTIQAMLNSYKLN